ncbi:MAG: hypothetical protein IJQ23_01795 [Clostridia bacterium]|nr:hypothetical protein [Clostridia bacterium]
MGDFDFNKAKREFYRDLKNESACKSIVIIRRIYQIVFYISIIAFFFIINALRNANSNTFAYIGVIVGYVSSYFVLVSLRALEHLIKKMKILEQELSAKGIIDNRLPPNDTENGKN